MMKEDVKEATILIGVDRSICSACNKIADYREEFHFNALMQEKGCNAKFTKCGIWGQYFGYEKDAIILAAQERRPDLPFVM
jgi:hypothetical protein